MSTTAALAYHEPSISTILILSSFLILLNIINYIGNKLVYCGLIGQILVGIGWGTPGADWLSAAVQDAVLQLGYLGLILMVYEGGLATNVKTLRANLVMSALVATIGIGCPIAVSFLLIELMNITPLQAFAAGAALCSTSLGTTFTVLSTSGLSESRLGVVLSSAAMMDDVVGLIMVKVVSNLGQASSSFDAITVVRPVLVSIGLAVALPVACVWIVKPLVLAGFDAPGWLYKFVTRRQLKFMLFSLALLAMVAGSSYAGTSNLFAAYLTGLAATWSDGLHSGGQQVTHVTPPADQDDATPAEEVGAPPADSTPVTPPVQGSSETPTTLTHGGGIRKASEEEKCPDAILPPQNNRTIEDHTTDAEDRSRSTAKEIFETYYAPAVETVVKPFFFAAIGFSIPIAQMFKGDIVWRGLVYALLMTLGKLLCGVCLLRFEMPGKVLSLTSKLKPPSMKFCWPQSLRKKRQSRQHDRQSEAPSAGSDRAVSHTPERRAAVTPAPTAKLASPLSIYPAAMLGSAMVARGEIGFLISSVAESTGIYGAGPNGGSSELFLVVTWAILICTIVGPLVVGVLTKRVKKLQIAQREEGSRSGTADPLGVWGVVAHG